MINLDIPDITKKIVSAACTTVRTRKRTVLAMCSALVDDEVDGPLEVVLEAAITPRMTAIKSARRKTLRS